MKLAGLALVLLTACGMATLAVAAVRHLHATGSAGGVEWLAAFGVVVLALFIYAAFEENRL